MPLEHYEIAERMLGTPDNPGGVWAEMTAEDHTNGEVFDPGSPARPKNRTRRAIAMELGHYRVMYTIEMAPSLRNLKAECLVLDPTQPITTNKVKLAVSFGTHACHLNLTEIRWQVEEQKANLLSMCEAALRNLSEQAQAQDPEGFVNSLHPPAVAGLDTGFSVPTISGGAPGTRRPHRR